VVSAAGGRSFSKLERKASRLSFQWEIVAVRRKGAQMIAVAARAESAVMKVPLSIRSPQKSGDL
jgi:hypothetical protein